MRREGRLRGRPTNKTKSMGQRCRSREIPLEKSRPKRKGHRKEFAGDFCTNPALADFALQRSRKYLSCGSLEADFCDNCPLAVFLYQLERRQKPVRASDHAVHGCKGDDETISAILVDTVWPELASGAEVFSANASSIGAIELAFQQQLGIFENAVEGSSFSEFANEGWSTLSEESWSDVELAESDEETSADDDWSMVDVDEIGGT